MHSLSTSSSLALLDTSLTSPTFSLAACRSLPSWLVHSFIHSFIHFNRSCNYLGVFIILIESQEVLVKRKCYFNGSGLAKLDLARSALTGKKQELKHLSPSQRRPTSISTLLVNEIIKLLKTKVVKALNPSIKATEPSQAESSRLV